MNWLANIPPFIGLILVTAGVPGFAILYSATQYLNTSLLLFVAYELVVIVGGFIRPGSE
jgi:hypothetical protein